MIRTLVVAGPQQTEPLSPWLEYLDRTGQVAVELTDRPARLTDLDGFDVVVAHAPRPGLEPEEEAGLCDFLQAGGGLVGLHCTNARWAAGERYRRLVGASVDGQLSRGELVTEVRDQSHDITRRLGGRLTVLDSCYTQVEAPDDCQILLDTIWQSKALPVAYVRDAGRGRVFFCGVGESASTFQAAPVQELLYRAVRFAAGRREQQLIGVGMVGFGAIGGEHASAISKVPGLQLRSVCDRSSARLEAALSISPTATAVSEAEATLADDRVGLVVISTPPNTHAELVLRSLQAGKAVAVEKPFCLTSAEADGLIALAEREQLPLTVYQNRRWDPDFLALQRLVRQRALGDIFHLESFVGGYAHPCHFWHSDEAVSGGVIFDWGAHYLDWILQLMPGMVTEVSATQQKLLWHDVTNQDHFQLRLRFEGGAEAEFLHSDIAAARKPKWYVLGTEGAAVGEWRQGSIISRDSYGTVTEDRLPVTDLPCELHLLTPDGRGGSHDQLISLPDRPPEAFYRNLAGHLLAGEPLAVTPRSAQRNVAVMEAAMRSARERIPISVAI